jgi:hypothetical protein
MKLPSATDRANLKLNDCGQRLLWALAQYFGALTPNPAVAANIPAGIASSAGNRGVVPDIFKSFPNFPNQCGWLGQYRLGYRFEVRLLVDASQFARNQDAIKCLKDLSLDPIEPMLGIPSSGTAIADNSTAVTIEQYILEQWRLYQEDRSVNAITQMVDDNPDGFSFMDHVLGENIWGVNSAFDTSNYSSTLLPSIVLQGNIVKKPHLDSMALGTQHNANAFPINPWEVCTFSNYNLLAAA